MTGTVLVVTSGKGGVGKSTTALNLGVALGVGGHSVALVDADLGMANLGGMLGVESEPTLHDVLAGEADVESAVVLEGEAFGIVPGAHDLAAYAEADPERLPDVLATLTEEYEFVVVDAGAGLGYADVVPIDAADEVILVTTPSDAAVGDTAKLLEFAGVVEAQIRGVVVTRADEDTDAEAIAATVGADLLGVVPEDPAVPDSTAASAPLEQHAPDSPAAAVYRRLAGAVAGDADDEDDAEAADASEAPESVAAAAPDEAPDAGDVIEEVASTEEEAAPDEDETPGEDSNGNADSTGERESGDGEPAGDDPADGQPVEEEPASGEPTDADSPEEDGNGGFFARLRGLF